MGLGLLDTADVGLDVASKPFGLLTMGAFVIRSSACALLALLGPDASFAVADRDSALPSVEGGVPFSELCCFGVLPERKEGEVMLAKKLVGSVMLGKAPRILLKVSAPVVVDLRCGLWLKPPYRKGFDDDSPSTTCVLGPACHGEGRGSSSVGWDGNWPTEKPLL